MAAFSSSVPQHKVFINFRGYELRNNFLAHLNRALKSAGINAFVDEDDGVGKDISVLFDRIEESRIAVVIFSSMYSESEWCLDELVKMKERAEEGKLVTVPIFYKLQPCTVKELQGDFGKKFWELVSRNDNVNKVKKWKDALVFVARKMGSVYDGTSNEVKFIDTITEKIMKVLMEISPEGGEKISVNLTIETEDKPVSISTGKAVKHENVDGAPDKRDELLKNVDNLGSRGPETLPEIRQVPEPKTASSNVATTTGSSGENVFFGETEEPETIPLFGSERRLERLEEKMKFQSDITRVVGVVGMPGIGKTTLVKTLFRKWEHKFSSRVFFRDIRRTSKDNGLHWLQMKLVQKLLNEDKSSIVYTENEHEHRKSDLLKRKAFIVLDDVDSEKQIEFLLGELDWVNQGSKIVITTNDKSLISDLVDNTYIVPRLTARDSFNCFSFHAFGDHISTPQGSVFMKLSRRFVDYAGGNPLALKVLGEELRGKDKTHWEQEPDTLAHGLSKRIQDTLRIRYDQLSSLQKQVFLDVACFFRSEDVSFVRSLVDSQGPESRGELGDLVDKFLVYISGGRVEMHDILFTFGKGLGSQNRCRLWKHGEVIGALKNKLGTENVRGIYLDVSEGPEETHIDSDAFVNMRNLLYLKIYDSQCPRECEADSKIDFPDGFQFPLDEVRYLHWQRFPLTELPQDFNPKNLVDLRLPYSKIQVVWRDAKEASKLKWVDLNHSDSLCNLSGLLGATSLQRLNLEGCTSLSNLPKEMQNMRSLVFLNLRGCTNLRVLKEMNLTSLKTLVLSDCSNLEEFRVISESLEALYLDGTVIRELPKTIGKLQRLVLLNLRCCKMLVSLPDSLSDLISLKELILSGCSKLEIFPGFSKKMERLETLLLDGTAIKETETENISCPDGRDGKGLSARPCFVNGVSFLRRLCLSGNDKICGLPHNLCELHHMQCLELKHCTNLTSIPRLPPNLERLDAHCCNKLRTVARPLALLTLSEPMNSAFIFSNCNDLGRVAKDNIASCARRKFQLYALRCYNMGFVSEATYRTCYPGCEVPSWFRYKTVGSVIEPKLPPHWHKNRLSGIALCAVVSFGDNRCGTDQISVECICTLKSEDGSRILLRCEVGGWIEPDKTDSDHVFIGYTSCSHIMTHPQGQMFGECIPTEASLEFKTTNGSCEVVNCGFSFVYAEPNDVPDRPNRNRTASRSDNSKLHMFMVCCLLFYGMFFASEKICAWLFRIFAALILIGFYADS